MKKRPASDSRGSLGGASSSSSSALSAAKSGNSSRTPSSSIGWGWFDGSLVDVKDADGKSAKAGKSKKKKQKGGLLQGFSSAILGESIQIPLQEPGELAGSDNHGKVRMFAGFPPDYRFSDIFLNSHTL